MKKKLESELMSIAHRILKLKGREDVIKMHAEVALLYEKLSVLKFVHDNFEGDIPTIGSDSSFFEMLDVAFNNKVSDNIEIEDKIYINVDEVEDDDIMEPVMSKIKDMVSQMPENDEEVAEVFEKSTPEKLYYKNNLEDITAGFEDVPVFEPMSKNTTKAPSKQSLNDRLKHGSLNIGLNDKIAFTKHLFDGKIEDYERVLSQIITTNSYVEASRFIKDIVKPDYNNWKGKEVYEERLMEIIQSKFD
ncbi:hypothetical protein ACS386_02280 [Flavobacteriaceae bacterium LMO-SS05]|jgi:hypothetical protein